MRGKKMSLPYPEVKQLLEVVSWIHVAPPWQAPVDFFAVLNKVITFDFSMAFLKLEASTHKIVPFSRTVISSGGDEGGIVRDYNDHFWKLKKPFLDQIVENPDLAFDLTGPMSCALPRNQVREFKSDFWKKHQIGRCYARYIKTGEGLTGIYLGRPPGSRDFSEKEKTCFDLLVPHLESALRQDRRKENCFFSDARGRIVSADEPSETLFTTPALASRLRHSLTEWSRSVMADPIKPFRARIQEKGGEYRFTVVPFGLGKSSLFRVNWDKSQRGLPAEVLQRFIHSHSLSSRQQEVLSCVLSGKQMKEMAQELNLAMDTVKEYLGALYRKTGVDGRGPLIAKVLSGMTEE
jgi:DNA-binding CsgD family transcriptional regulator